MMEELYYSTVCILCQHFVNKDRAGDSRISTGYIEHSILLMYTVRSTGMARVFSTDTV
jgi:hypothetical protein